MNSIFTITIKDITQIIRDRKSFLFLLIMPIAFTYLFGYIFRSTDSSGADSRLQVGLANLDSSSVMSQQFENLLKDSQVIRIIDEPNEKSLEKQVSDEKLSAGILIPAGYGDALKAGTPMKMTVWADTSSMNGLNAEAEINGLAGRLASAVQTARILSSQGDQSYEQVFHNALTQWKNPPVKISAGEVKAESLKTDGQIITTSSYAHSSPGMILQFAVAGLTTCANVIVLERKNRCLQRLLTTATSRLQVLCGHFISIFLILLAQMVLLILFGDVVLKLTYLRHPLASLLIAVASSLCVAGLGLLIGVLCKSEEQAVAFSMICMFIFSGLGGLWVPLESTGTTFQILGHFTPLSWAMDGFKNVLVRGLGIQSAWQPAAVLAGFTILFLTLAVLKFKTE
jgi:ABC-2 type transport system permease protein